MIVVDFVNVGYGEAIVITNKKKSFCVVVDGGSNNENIYSNNETGRIRLVDYLEKENIKVIDAMFCTHIHDDHVGGLLEAAKHMEVKRFYQPFPSDFYKELDSVVSCEKNKDTELFINAICDYINICKLVAENGEVCRCHITEKIEINSKCKIEILGPNSKQVDFLRFYFMYALSFSSKNLIMMLDEILNNYSLVMKLSYNGTKLLLPGDLTYDGYDELSAKKLHADIYKIGHHGQKDGINEKLIKKIEPDTVVVCADSERRYNSACPEVVSMLEAKGIKVFFSDAVTEYGVLKHCATRLTIKNKKIYEVEYI